MKKVFCIFLFAACNCCCHAQQKDAPKFLNHYIGLQANQLLKELINLNADNTIIKNPYLLAYGVFSVKYKLGIQAGFGYNYHRFRDKLSLINEESKRNNVFWRIGIARNFLLGKKWEATAGLDYAASYQYNKIFALSVVKFGTTTDSTTTITSSLNERKGGQLQLRLGFHLSEHIMLTTESTFHYFITHDKKNILLSESAINSSNPELNTFTLSASNSDVENSTFNITPPVALFLTIKF